MVVIGWEAWLVCGGGGRLAGVASLWWWKLSGVVDGVVCLMVGFD